MEKNEFVKVVQYAQDVQMLAMIEGLIMSVSLGFHKGLDSIMCVATLHRGEDIQSAYICDNDDYMGSMKKIHEMRGLIEEKVTEEV